MREDGHEWHGAACEQSSLDEASVMCGAKCQRHPLGTMTHTVRKLVALDGRVAGLRTATGNELRGQLVMEMEGLAVVAVHDLARLLWDLRGGYPETYSD